MERRTQRPRRGVPRTHEEGGDGEERRHAAAHMTRAYGEPWHTGRVEVVAAP